jgi:Tol biopolymer transport system component
VKASLRDGGGPPRGPRRPPCWPRGRTIVYSAAWDGGPLELYTKRVGDRESRRHGLQGARVLSVSRSGELAVQLLPAGAPLAYYLWGDGTLARVPLAGGTPRELVKDVQSADWSPDGTQLAVSRWVEGKGVYRVEYPVGVVLYQSENRIIVVRVSPAGDRVAFLESISLAQTNTQQLHVVDRSGRDRVLTEGWGMAGIAWSPTGREIWNDIYDRDAQRAIRAVTLSGKVRPLLRFGGSEGSLSDVSVGGQALLVEGHGRHVIFGTPPGARGERNLSWNDDSSAVDLSRDGKTLLFTELLSGGGRSYGTSMRSMDGSPAVRLGDGYGVALSPDGRWALAFTAGGAALEFNLLPTGAGEARHLSEGLPAVFYGADWLPDSRSFVFSGSSSGGPARLYVQDIDGGAPRLLRDDDLTEPVISSDGSMLAAFDAYGQVMMAPLAGGDVRPVPGVEDGERPLEWRADGRTLYVYREDRLPVEVFEVDVATGTRRPVKEIALRGLSGVDPPHVVLALTPDAAGYAYSYRLALDELYLVTGLGR